MLSEAAPATSTDISKSLALRLFPPLNIASSELMHLDALRFIASYAIVFSHFKVEAYSWPGSESLFKNTQTMNVFVDVFFVISGIVIAYIYNAKIDNLDYFGKFMRKRVARLAPLHWATLIFYVILAIVGTSLGAPEANSLKYDWNCLLPNFLAIHSLGVCKALSFNNVSWSISAEMVMYAIFPILALAAYRKPLIVLICSLLLACGLTTLDLWFYGHLTWTERTYNFAPLRALPAFTLGVAVFFNKDRLTKLRIPPAATYVCVLGLITATMMGASKLISIPLAYTSAILAYNCDLNKKPSNAVRILATGGALTYSIYMLHPIIGIISIKIFGVKILHLSGWALNFWILATALAVLPTGYLSFTWFETPLRRALSGTGRSEH